MVESGGWEGRTGEGISPDAHVTASAPAAVPLAAPALDAAFSPGSELARAFDTVSAALRTETARVMASQVHAVERQTSEIIEQARKDAAEMVERAARLQEAARAAVDQVSGRYESMLRIIGQLSSGLAQIRDQADAEFEALQRHAREADAGNHPSPGWPEAAGGPQARPEGRGQSGL